MPPLQLLASVAGGPPPPTPTPWPEQYHAVLLTNYTESGGRLELVDVYYDWPRGRTLNILRAQLSGEPVFDILWANGSTYAFDHSASPSCTAALLPVGLLPPDWVDGASYVGRDVVGGFDCHVWSHRFFTRYYEEVATGRPVFWVFAGEAARARHEYNSDAPGVDEHEGRTIKGWDAALGFPGILRHVLRFEVGGVPEKNSPKWQAPAYCFDGSNSDAAQGVDGEGNRADVMNGTVRFVHATASFD